MSCPQCQPDEAGTPLLYFGCPDCESKKWARDKHATPVVRDGVVLRAHNCLAPACGRTFLSAQLVIVNEFEPVARLDAVLKALMDESDARSRAEIEGAESLEGMVE